MTTERQGTKWVVGLLIAGILAVVAVYVFVFANDDDDSHQWSGPVAAEPREERSQPPSNSDPLAGMHTVVRERPARMVDDAGVRLTTNDSPTVHSMPGGPAHPPGTLIVRDPSNPDAPPRIIDRPIRTGETTPEMLLQRARAIQAMLDRRETTLNEERQQAVAAGETERVAHIDQQLQRIQFQRPSVARRIAELEEQAHGG